MPTSLLDWVLAYFKKEELLDWVHTYLAQDENLTVPVKKMWNEWHTRYGTPPLEIFTALVLADSRIEKTMTIRFEKNPDAAPEALAEYIRELETAGFFEGPRVKLKSRELTMECVTQQMIMRNEQLLRVLQQSRETSCEYITEHEEGYLIEAIIEIEKSTSGLRAPD